MDWKHNLPIENKPAHEVRLLTHKPAPQERNPALLSPPLPTIQQQRSKPKTKQISRRHRLPGHQLKQHVLKIQDKVRIPLKRYLLRSDHEVHQLYPTPTRETVGRIEQPNYV